MDSLDERIARLSTERVRDPDGSWRLMTPVELARVAVRAELEDAARDLDRFVAMGDDHGRVSCVALVREAQKDIRARGSR